MEKTIVMGLQGNPADMLRKARVEAQAAGAIFQGDESVGSFSGSGVVGHYRIEGGQLTVTITDKPFYATWGMVESEVRGFFARFESELRCRTEVVRKSFKSSMRLLRSMFSGCRADTR